MDNKKAIGYRIATALSRKNKLQKDLAKELGVKDNIISYFCGGQRTPNFQQLVSIAKYLDVTTDYLLGLTDVPSRDEDIQKAHDTTGLSEYSINALHYLKEIGDYDTAIEFNRDQSFEAMGCIEVLDSLLTHSEFALVLNDLARFYLCRRTALSTKPEENIDLESDEWRKYQKWLNENGMIVLNKDSAGEMYLQSACNGLREIAESVADDWEGK
jgi:transcriptional regulator with XRE-family HTH domain